MTARKLVRDKVWQGRWQHRSLLPSNAIEMERRMEAAMALLETVPVPHRQLMDPNACPEHLLPWLAWALSVDRWEGSWDVAVKRRVLASSFARHQIKGTKASLQAVLEDHKLEPLIVEWFEQSPKGEPYTFLVELDAVLSVLGDQAILSNGTLALVNELVQVTKSLRSGYSIRLNANFENQLGLVSAAHGLGVKRSQAVGQWTPPGLSSASDLATAAVPLTVRRSLLAVRQQELSFAAISRAAATSAKPLQVGRVALTSDQRGSRFSAKTNVGLVVTRPLEISRILVRSDQRSTRFQRTKSVYAASAQPLQVRRIHLINDQRSTRFQAEVRLGSSFNLGIQIVRACAELTVSDLVSKPLRQRGLSTKTPLQIVNQPVQTAVGLSISGSLRP